MVLLAEGIYFRSAGFLELLIIGGVCFGGLAFVGLIIFFVVRANKKNGKNV